MGISTLAAVVVACSLSPLWNTFSATFNQKRTNPAYEEPTGYLAQEQRFGVAHCAVEEHPDKREPIAYAEMETVN